jgi:hypothetical protein
MRDLLSPRQARISNASNLYRYAHIFPIRERVGNNFNQVWLLVEGTTTILETSG